jgi:hypothetical protein
MKDEANQPTPPPIPAGHNQNQSSFDFRGVFWGDFHNKTSQGETLYSAIFFLLVALGAFGVVVFVLSGLDVGRVILAIIGTGAGLLSWFMFSTWNSGRQKPPGVYGFGMKISEEGLVEVGEIGVQVSDPSQLPKSAEWKSSQTFTGEREVLVNIMRTEKRGWMIANLVFSVESGREVRQLDFIEVLHDTQSKLWIADGKRVIWLSQNPIVSQFQLLSEVLLGLQQRPGGRLKLTFTEFSTTASSVGSNLGAVGGIAAVVASNSRQTDANDYLARGELPPDSPISTDLVKKYGYELQSNEKPKKFRHW